MRCVPLRVSNSYPDTARGRCQPSATTLHDTSAHTNSYADCMPGIRISTVIKAPISRVWQVVEPVERHVDWMADAESIEFIGDQRRGVGTAFLCVTKVGPIRLTDKMRITEWQVERAMGVEHVGVVTGRGVFTLHSIDGNTTEFTWEEQLQFPWWLGGPLGALIGGQLVLRGIWKRNLRRLAALCE
ncbi:MAG: SRPBCC family protein [Actinobacteria bacterium]|nr:SRPBCC family protein [Actinomycetota bacterium]